MTRTLRILAIVSDADADKLAGWRELGEIRTVASISDAVAALRAETFDFVVTTGGQLAPLANVVGLESAEAILDRIGQGVAVVDREGRLVYANTRLKAYPQEAVDQIREACQKAFQEWLAEPNKADVANTRRRTVRVGDELFFDITISALCAADGEIIEVVGLCWDVTPARKLQEKVNAIDAAGRELVHLNTGAVEALPLQERLKILEEKIIRYTHDLMHFDQFAVRVLDKKTNKLDTVISSGFSEEAKSLDIMASPEGNGITGYVAATGRSYISPDVRKDPRYLFGIEDARSSLTVPLMLNDQVVGTLNVESNQVAAFTEDDRQFAEIFGRYIAMALQILRLLVVERRATTGQLAADVAAELAAPLNDIITDTVSVLEDFIGHDDLRRRLNAIIENVDRVKRSIQQLSQPRGITGMVDDAPSDDPVLSGKRILIAEDEDVIRDTISEVLTRGGALTYTAADGHDALALLHQQKFDLVLTDIKMPGCSGYEVFAAARAAGAKCPVIMITGFGYDPDHAIVRASREGLAAVLFKPFKVEDLIQQVRDALKIAK